MRSYGQDMSTVVDKQQGAQNSINNLTLEHKINQKISQNSPYLLTHSLPLPRWYTSLPTFPKTFPNFSFPNLLLTISSNNFDQSMHAQQDWINPTVYSYFSMSSLLPISSKIARPIRYRTTSFWYPSKSQIFRVVSRLRPRLKIVKNHSIRNNYDFICNDYKCLATQGWLYLRSTSNTLQQIWMLLSQKLYMFLKNLLQSMRLENILNASILPTTIVSTITGYVMPCTQLISGLSKWNISNISCTSALRTSLLFCPIVPVPLTVCPLVPPLKIISILLLKERMMSRFICDFTWGSIQWRSRRYRSSMQREFVRPSWFSKMNGQILWRCQWGMNFLRQPAVFCLNFVGLEIWSANYYSAFYQGRLFYCSCAEFLLCRFIISSFQRILQKLKQFPISPLSIPVQFPSYPYSSLGSFLRHRPLSLTISAFWLINFFSSSSTLSTSFSTLTFPFSSRKLIRVAQRVSVMDSFSRVSSRSIVSWPSFVFRDCSSCSYDYIIFDVDDGWG